MTYKLCRNHTKLHLNLFSKSLPFMSCRIKSLKNFYSNNIFEKIMKVQDNIVTFKNIGILLRKTVKNQKN